MSTVTAANLFAGAGPKSDSKYKLEFKAGKLIREGNKIRAEKRNGTVFLQQTEDSLLHFCWKERNTPNVEDDFIVFPDEAEWVCIPQCTTGRAFVLKFKTSSQRLFYWMQEVDETKDEEITKKLNALLSGAASAEESVADASEQAQLMKLLQGTAGVASNSKPQGSQPPVGGTSLASALSPEQLRPVLADSRLREQLFPLLPEKHDHTEKELTDLIKSPQFQQAVQSLDAALQSGELGPLLQELGLDPNIAVASGDRVKMLLDAIKKKKQQQQDSMDMS